VRKKNKDSYGPREKVGKKKNEEKEFRKALPQINKGGREEEPGKGRKGPEAVGGL